VAILEFLRLEPTRLGRMSMGARREVVSAVTERYGSANAALVKSSAC
jgi:hypothetical protein